jgi:hypothetical protein
MDKSSKIQNKNLTMTITHDWIPQETIKSIDTQSPPKNNFVSLKNLNATKKKFKLNLTNKQIPVMKSEKIKTKYFKGYSDISKFNRTENHFNKSFLKNDRNIPTKEDEETFEKSSYQNTDPGIYNKSFSNRSTFYHTKFNNTNNYSEKNYNRKTFHNQSYTNKNEDIIFRKANTHRPIKILDKANSTKNPTRLLLLNRFETCDSNESLKTKTHYDLSLNKFRNLKKNIVVINNNSKISTHTRLNQTQTTKASSFVRTQTEIYSQHSLKDIPSLQKNLNETIDRNYKIINSLSNRKSQEIIDHWSKVQFNNNKQFKNISLLNNYIFRDHKNTKCSSSQGFRYENGINSTVFI